MPGQTFRPSSTPRDRDEIAVLRSLCTELAISAGDLARGAISAGVDVAATKTSRVDVVTEVDRDVERHIRVLLAEERPDDAILGEEGEHVAGTSGLTWVVDPIDGTVNMLYGIPSYSVSVAVVEGDGTPAASATLAGAVHLVPVPTTWSAGRGQGADRDGVPIAVRPAPALAEALVSTGFGYDPQRRAYQVRVLQGVVPHVRDIRRIGSFAVDLCLVAEGHLDAHYERGVQPWDMAAGALVLTEAGGVVSGLAELTVGESMTIATTPGLLPALSDLLVRAGALDLSDDRDPALR